MGEPFRKPSYNRFSRAKLIGTKWTHLQAQGREKHYMVHKWDPEREEVRDTVIIEAVLTRRTQSLAISDLRDQNHWRMGWH